MAATLIETSAGHSRTHLLGDSIVHVGRDPTNDIVLSTRHVSGQHLEISWDGERHLARDVGSKNGTLLNGQRLSESSLPSEPRALNDGDELLLGGVSLLYRGEDRTLTLHLPAGAVASGLVVDRDRAEVRVDGELLRLAPKEYRAIVTLYDRRGRLVSRDDFAALVWPENDGITSAASIDRLVSDLRTKLKGRYLTYRKKLGVILEI
jgi:hypothetical protein